MEFQRIADSPSRSLLSILTAFCFGIVIGRFTELVWIPQLPFVLSLLIAGAILMRSKKNRLILLIIIALIGGVFRYQQSLTPQHIPTVADHVQKSVRIEGVVRNEVQRRISSQEIIIKDVRVAGTLVHGDVLVRLSLYPQVRYRDQLQFNCRLEKPEPFNGFRYDRYLASKGVLAVCGFPQFIEVTPSASSPVVGWLLKQKANLRTHLSTRVTQPHASFLFGLLFGGDSGLTSQMKESFSKTGVSHILAASGFNVSLFSVVFLGWILSTKVKRAHALWVTAVLLFVYMILAGVTPSVIRATIMASAVLVQIAVARKPFMPNVIAITLSFMLLMNPRLLMDDVGFQLSFVATMSMLIFVQKWKYWFTFLPDRYGIREAFASTMIASMFTLPIILWHFGSISIVSPITNLLILPVIPYVMAFTIAGLVLSIISSTLAQLILIPAWVTSGYILHIIQLLSSSSFVSFAPESAKFIASTLVGVGVLMIYLLYEKKKH